MTQKKQKDRIPRASLAHIIRACDEFEAALRARKSKHPDVASVLKVVGNVREQLSRRCRKLSEDQHCDSDNICVPGAAAKGSK